MLNQVIKIHKTQNNSMMLENSSNSQHEQIQGVKEITHVLDDHINLAEI